MHRFPLVLLGFCWLCVWLIAAVCPSASADPPHPSDLRSDILYTTKGEFVQVSPMRALTLNAHVEQVQYDPLGLELAYVGSETDGDQTVHFVKTIDARTGKEINHLTVMGASDDKRTNFLLLGWSLSGKYLLLQRFTPDPNAEDTAVNEYLRWDLSVIPPVIHMISPAANLPPGLEAADGEGDGSVSPDRHWIIFGQDYHRQNADGEPLFPGILYLLYDPELDTFRPLALPPKAASSLQWGDKTHLDFWLEGTRQQIDVVTGAIRPHKDFPTVDVSTFSKKYPDLTLDTEFREQDDAQGTGGFLDSTILWIRRTPATKRPLGAASAGILPRKHRLDLSESDDDPQAVWSPTGQQIAFIASGNLYVTDLRTPTIALPREKMAVGLKLSCDDERELAMSNLKQIGLGIIQYSQDNDEKLPAAEGFTDTIYPYIKSRDVFSVDAHPFVYVQPADLSLAKMEDPAHTEQGYIDLPCARVVLFADGHVKSFPKAGNGDQE